MNALTAYTKRMGLALLAAAILCCTLSSCNNTIYDDEGDCSVHYLLRFCYDRNLKWADAFAHEVVSVHLYAFGEDGTLVWHKSDSGGALAAEDYAMRLDLPAGNYRLLAWCGLDSDEGNNVSFSVPEARVGITRIGELQCSLNRLRDAAGAYSKERLRPLFHGMIDVNLPAADNDGGKFVFTMPLTKDTNHIRVILQHLSGEDVDTGKFTFFIEDENGLLAHDNALLPDENITYRPWKTQSSEAGFDGGDNTSAVTTVKGAVADLTVGRMTEEHRRKMMLTIANDRGETVAHIPVIDYALMAKDYYEEEYGHTMDNQEFLDREDNYVLTFFLDEQDRWIDSYIHIHSWRVVLQDAKI